MAWVILVEEVTGMNRDRRWTLSGSKGDFETADEARKEALHLARNHVPHYPWSEHKRVLYRLSENAYLVDVQGTMSEFHFRLTVAERLDPETGEPDAVTRDERALWAEDPRFFAP